MSKKPPSKDVQQQQVKAARERRKKQAERKMRKRRLLGNGLRPILVTGCITAVLAYVAYTNSSLSDGYEEEEAYVIQNVGFKVETKDGYAAKILTPSTTLTIYGDEKKVRQMKEQDRIPEVVLDAKRKREGEHAISPDVVDGLIGVNYHFSPAEIDVEVIQAERREYDVLERYYGVAAEGFYVERIIAEEQATLLLTEDEMLQVGYVVADLDVSTITETGVYMADVVVLDKRGQVIDLPIETEQVQVAVTYSPLSWYQRQQDIKTLTAEIQTLESELNERRAKLPTVTDLLQRTDLEKEISFREQRLPIKKQELIEKETGLAEAKANEEAFKLSQKQESLMRGGEFKDVK